MSVEYRNPTEVELNRIISVENVQTRNQASLAGELLKAMDITACLAAEKHAKLPCVTLLMDDLVVDENLFRGEVLNVKAKLTRSFGSSMEVVVEVSLQDMLKQQQVNVCKAYFVFVARAKVGKAKLPHLDPVGIEERLEYALAIERRKLRYAARSAAKDIKSSVGQAVQTAAQSSDTGRRKVPMSQTAVESTELVLPSQANHHQMTFGGQIMAWLVSTCTIAASRFCQKSPSIIAVNGVHFLEKSNVGDRLLFKAMVNKTFHDNSFEVGCRVESSTLEGKTAHINSAYLKFAVFDDKTQRQQLPVVIAATAEQVRRQGNAEQRHRAQIEKEKILGTVGPALSVLWTVKNSDVLACHNVTAFQKLCHVNTWHEVSRDGSGCVFYTSKQDEFTCVKLEATIANTASDVFKALLLKTRASWDPIIAQSQVVRKIDDDDSIVHIVMAISCPEKTPPGKSSAGETTQDKSSPGETTPGKSSPGETTPKKSSPGETTPVKSTQKPSDLLVMESIRSSPVKDAHVIAYRSVTMPSYPVSDQYERKENLTSGFVIEELATDPSQSTLTYINQITNQVAGFTFNDLQGGTKVYATRIEKLREFLNSSA